MHSLTICSLLAVLFAVGLVTVAEGSFSGFSEQFQYQRSTCGQLCEPISSSTEASTDGSSSSGNSYVSSTEASTDGSSSSGNSYVSSTEASTDGSSSSGNSYVSSTEASTDGSSSSGNSYVSSTEGVLSTTSAQSSSSPSGVSESESWQYSSSSEGSGGSFVSCKLTNSFYNFSLNLTVEEREIFVVWIKKIQTTILVDASLTYEQMVVEIAYSLKAFFAENPDIEVVISYEWIEDWGYVTDFIHVAYMINMEVTEEIITLDANDDCPLFDSLRTATAQDSEKAAATENLIVNITIILDESSWTYAQQQAAIYQLWIEFFEVHESWESFFYSIEIEGYGLLEYYIDVTLIYQETTTLYTVASGSTSSCVLLTSLQDAYENDSFSVSVRNEIKQLYIKLEAYFESNVEVSVRLDYVMSECWSEYQLISYILPYLDQISCGDWGFFYEIIYSGCVCEIYGCGCLECGPGTEAPSTDAITVSSTAAEVSSTAAEVSSTAAEVSSTAAEVSSTAAEVSSTAAEVTTTTTEVPSTATTVLTTTITEVTTTIKPADCSTVLEVIFIDSNNETIFLNNIIDVTNNWTNSQRAGIQTSINLYREQIYSSKTQKAIFSKCVNITNDYSKNYKTQHNKLLNIELIEWKGTVGNFCSCESKVKAS